MLFRVLYEESQNGREVNIHILYDDIWTPEVFRGHRVLIGSLEGVPGTPNKRYGPYGPRGETHQPQRGWCAPYIWASQIGEGKGKEKRKKGIGFPLPPL